MFKLKNNQIRSIIFSFFLITTSNLTLNAQCTPTNCISTLPPYGGVCDSFFVDGTVNQAYSDFESFHITTACFDAGIIDPAQAGTDVTMDIVDNFTFSGLPAGLTASTNQISYASPANGCISLSGTPTEIGRFEVEAFFEADLTVYVGCAFAVVSLYDNPASFIFYLSILPDPSFTIPSTTFNCGDGSVTLTPTGTTGGSFSGPGVSGTTFDPIAAGVGTHTIKYIVSAQQGAAIAPSIDSSEIQVTVNAQPALGTDTRTECDSYQWIDGNTYTASNNSATYNIVGGASNGCDSLVTLDLTIVNSTTGTDTRTECDSYQWIDGNTYTASNNSATYNIVGGASNGCDSLVTLDLTIVNATTGTDTRIECAPFTWIDGNIYTSDNNSATYTITAGNENGCDSVVTLDLTINSVSDLTTTTNGTSITANNTSATYQWLDCDNNNSAIQGETSQTYTATVNGNYAVELTENGCVDTSSCASITTVGLIENDFGSSIKVFPNPTEGNFSIDLGQSYPSLSIHITDANGKLIETFEFDGKQKMDFILNQPNGIYFVRIKANQKKAILRIVKQ